MSQRDQFNQILSKLCLIIILFHIVPKSNSQVINNSQCYLIKNENISCSFSRSYGMTIEYPAEKPKIIISLGVYYIIDTILEIKTECPSHSEEGLKVFNLLPKFDINVNFSLTWEKCPFLNESFKSTVNKLLVETGNFIQLEISDVNDTLTIVNLRGVKAFDLKIKGVTKINPDAFDELRDLETIWIEDFTPQKGFLRYQTRLLRMWIWRAAFQNLTADVFEGLSSVKQIGFYETFIRNFDVEVFQAMGDLSDIFFHDSQIELSSDMFSSYKMLKSVKIKNSVVNAPELLFANVKCQEIILIVNYKLTELPENLLVGAEYVTNLELQSNRLTHLPRNFFKDLTSLVKINLSWNLLQHLSFLEIVNSRIEIYKYLFVDASHNKLSVLVLQDLSKFRVLYVNVDYNNIKTVNMSIKVGFVTHILLSLYRNPLEYDCKNYAFLYNLQNKQETNFGSLNVVNYFNQPLEKYDLLKITCPYEGECPQNCSCFVIPKNNSLIMNCSENNFKEMPTYKLSVDIKVVLNLSKNYFKQLSISDSRNESTIDLSYNMIDTINIQKTSKTLKVLKLNGNRLTSLSESSLKALKDGNVSLTLDGNMWPCDCSTVDLLTFVVSIPENILDYENLTCANGQLFTSLSVEKLCPGNERQIAILATVIAVLGTIVAVYYKYRDIIKMWLYINNYCNCILDDNEFEKGKRYDAFVMYSYEDGDFVADHLVAELEQKEGYKLCCHERDWPGGPLIIDLVR